MKLKNIKQYELARLLNKSPENMSGFFSRLEAGGASNLKSLNEIAEALNVDISIFFAQFHKFFLLIRIYKEKNIMKNLEME